MSLPFINENSPRKLTVSFFDETGAPATPSSVTYKVDCLTTGTEIRAATPITPDIEVVISIDSNDTQIVDANNSREKRRITVIAGYVEGNESQEFDYLVKNMSGI